MKQKQRKCDMQEKITANANIPGFQKLSLVYLPDVGKSPSTYQLRFSPRPSDSKVVEDRAYNLRSVIEGYLGPGLIDNVECSSKEPNRTTVRMLALQQRRCEHRQITNGRRCTPFFLWIPLHPSVGQVSVRSLKFCFSATMTQGGGISVL